MRLDRIYITTGFVWLLSGMVYGIYLGASDQLNLANSHAHTNLLGFVLSTLFGLIYRGWPGMQSSRLAWPQYAIYELGAVVLVLGKYYKDIGSNGILTIPGSLLVVLGTVMMIWIFLRNGTEH